MFVGVWFKPVPYRWLTPFNEQRHLLEFFWSYGCFHYIFTSVEYLFFFRNL